MTRSQSGVDPGFFQRRGDRYENWTNAFNGEGNGGVWIQQSHYMDQFAKTG